MQSVLSPDVDAFATPPTTPTVLTDQIRPSLSRRSSKPSNLHLQRASADWNPNIVLDLQQSPDPVPVKTGPSIAAQINGKLSANDALPPVMAPTPTITQQSDTPAAGPLRRAPSPPVTSPCFLHSKLQGASFKDWLHSKQTKAHQDARMDLTHGSHKLEANPLRVSYPDGTLSEPYSGHNSEYGADEGEDDGEDGEYSLSLTKRLAETAVGVREMSKQLGRTCVHSHIQNVLIVTKARDNKLIKLTRELALYLMLKRRTGDRGMVVYVDSQLRTSRRFDAAGIERDHPQLFVPFPRRRSSSSSSVASGMQNGEGFLCSEGQLRYWTADMCSRSPHLFDFVVTLGGDGTVLFTSWLFQRIVPPVLPFALGSLGFLTNFDFADHQAVMDSAIDGGIRVNLRMRFTCTVYRAIAYDKARACRAIKKGDTGEILMRSVERGGWEALENGHQMHEGKSCTKDKEIMCFSTRPVESFEVLNDLVVDRGPSPYVSLLELFGDEHHLTTVQADGLTISTPTGSTAYSLSAGGSLVHPEIPAILITPICPHTLSFRPMLLPDTMELRICVPFNSRSTAWASFDGRGRVELKQGDHITVTASKYPFPTVCADTQSVDWFNSISRTLKWNERERQKSFVVVEENPLKVTARRESPEKSRHGQPTPTMRQHRLEKALRNVEDDEEEDEVSDEEEEKYDIDDLSSNESTSTAAESTKVSPVEAEMKVVVEDGAPKSREQADAEIAARVLVQGNPFIQTTRGRRRSHSGLRSGLDTPDRFAGPHPHPPKLSPRHVQFAPLSGSSSSSLTEQHEIQRGDHGSRDDIYSPRSAHSSTRVRIPRDRDVEGESLKTPTPTEQPRRLPFARSRSRERSGEGHQRRAFAVWGQDESDSATSDSDADA